MSITIVDFLTAEAEDVCAIINRWSSSCLSTMLSRPHICPVSEIPQATRTLTSAFNHESNAFISFIYKNHTPPPLIPAGKPEQVAISLYRTLAKGIVLTVDSEDEKCVGVAVWEGPNHQITILGKLRDYFVQGAFDIWESVNSIYYGGNGFDPRVFPPMIV
jgi:hypothetical protein